MSTARGKEEEGNVRSASDSDGRGNSGIDVSSSIADRARRGDVGRVGRLLTVHVDYDRGGERDAAVAAATAAAAGAN